MSVALRTITRIQDADDAPALGVDQNGYALTWDNASGAFVAADVGGLPLTAGSDNALTGPLYLDPGSDDSATVFRVPVTSTNNGDILFNVHRAEFSGIEDVVFNWGFNNAIAGGKSDAGLHSWYLQLENDYSFSAKRWVEYHLNLFPTSGDGFRPFQYQYTTDGTEGLLYFRATNFQVSNHVGTNQGLTIEYSAPDATQATVKVRGYIELLPRTTSPGLVIQNATSTFYQINGSDQQFRARITTFAAIDGTGYFTFSSVSGINTSLRRLDVNSTATSQPTLQLTGPASHSGPLLSALNSAAAVQFQIGPAGQIRTNQAAANTATPSGATSYQLPVYNAAGALLGYIPVYGSAWS
jgi:hypothetical protein